MWCIFVSNDDLSSTKPSGICALNLSRYFTPLHPVASDVTAAVVFQTAVNFATSFIHLKHPPEAAVCKRLETKIGA
jgi:hypothetical protein